MPGSPPDALLAITATCSRPTPRAERDGCSSPNSLTRASTRCATSIASPRASPPRRFPPKAGSRRAICWAAASSVSALWRRTGPSVRQLVSPSRDSLVSRNSFAGIFFVLGLLLLLCQLCRVTSSRHCASVIQRLLQIRLDVCQGCLRRGGFSLVRQSLQGDESKTGRVIVRDGKLTRDSIRTSKSVA